MPKFISNTVQIHIASFFDDINDYKILLLKRSENLHIYPGIWQVITGTIEKGETAKETAIREIKEETAIIAEKLIVIPYITSFFDDKKDAVNFSPVFGLIVNDKKIKISQEHSEYGWYSIDESYEKLILPSHNEGNKIFYDYILNNKLEQK